MLELSKGKLTTDSANHSGEGIFFTSRMFDVFLSLKQTGWTIATILNCLSDFLMENKLKKTYDRERHFFCLHEHIA